MSTTSPITAPSSALAAAIEEFGDPSGYLAVASIGIPPRRAVEALRADLDAWSRADRDPQGYDPVIARTRESYARLVGVDASRIAIGSQTSVEAALVAAAVPAGAEVLIIERDFSSLVAPFAARHDIRLRAVPLEALADSVTDDTWIVVFSAVQSSTGAVADLDAIVEAAARHDALTFCDTTQSTGVLPLDASRFDFTVCHTYKWLCSPRGVAFLTMNERAQSLLTPSQVGWYAGDDPWLNCYGTELDLAPDARRFDVSPAWQAWIGAEQSIGMFADLDIAEIWERTAGLGDALCDALGIPQKHQPIVAWPDEDGSTLRTLMDAGIRISGRAGRVRASFHLWNTLDDVELVARVLKG